MPVLLAAALLASATAPACSGGIEPKVDVVAIENPVVTGTDFDLAAIRGFAGQADDLPPHPVLGFYLGTFGYTITVEVPESDAARCAEPVSVRVSMFLISRHIEIARDLTSYPCLYRSALAHYALHAKADDAALSREVRIVKSALRKTQIAPFNDGSGSRELYRQEIKTLVQHATDEALVPFTPERASAQRAVDTPDEIRKLETACSQPT